MKSFFGRHYGWAIVVASFVHLMVTWGIIFNTNSLFLVPIEQSLGIVREQTMIAITLRGGAMALGSFAAGPLYERFSFMRVFRTASVLTALSYGMMALITNPAQYYMLSALHIGCITVAGFIPVTMMINRWFQKGTGSVMGLALVGSAAGGMVFSPVAGWLIPLLGWRAVNGWFAALMLLVILITTFMVFAETPQDFGLLPFRGGKDGDAGVSETIAQDPMPLGRAVFVLIVLGIILMNAGLNVLITNTAPHLQEVGMGLKHASLVMSVLMFSMGFGKFVMGILYDTIGVRKGSLLTTAAFLVGFAGLIYYELPLAVWISALGSGFGSAFNSLAPPIFARALYGVGRFTRVNAFFQGMGAMGAMIAPPIVAALYGRQGNYFGVFHWFFLLISLTVFIWMMALPDEKNREDGDPVKNKFSQTDN